MTRLFKDRKWEELCRERRLIENSMNLLFVFSRRSCAKWIQSFKYEPRWIKAADSEIYIGAISY